MWYAPQYLLIIEQKWTSKHHNMLLSFHCSIVSMGQTYKYSTYIANANTYGWRLVSLAMNDGRACGVPTRKNVPYMVTGQNLNIICCYRVTQWTDTYIITTIAILFLCAKPQDLMLYMNLLHLYPLKVIVKHPVPRFWQKSRW